MRSPANSRPFETVPIETCLAELEDGRKIHQGWSPQCEKAPAADNEWGVLKTTSIQAGRFEPQHNKRLPAKLAPRPHLMVKEGDILLTCAGPRHRCGIACLVRHTRGRVMISGKMYRFRANPATIRSDYLEAFLQTETARQAIDRMKTGISDSGLNLTHDRFRNLTVPLVPLDEQERIIAEIEKQFTRLDAGVTSLKRVQAALKRYRASVLKAACEGCLVPTEAELARKENRSYEPGELLLQRILKERREKWSGRGKYKEPSAPELANLPKLPEGWAWAAFDQITSLITKGSSPRWQGFEYSDTGVTFVRSENVRWGYLDLTDVAHLPARFNQKEKKSVLHTGDVLLNLVGASIGRAAVALDEVHGGNTNQAVAVIRTLFKQPLNQFAVSWLISAEAQKLIHAEKVDVARANFSLENTRVLPIPLPPLAEQQRIIAELERRSSVIDEIDTMTSTELQRATGLRQSILQQAFSAGLATTPGPGNL